MNNPFKTGKIYAGPEPVDENSNDSAPVRPTYPQSTADASLQKYMTVYAGPDFFSNLEAPGPDGPKVNMVFSTVPKGMQAVTPDMQSKPQDNLGFCPMCGVKREFPGKFCPECGFYFKKDE